MNASMRFDPAQFSILFPIGGVDFNILELLIWAAFICGVAFFWRKAATSWSTYFGALAIVAGVAFGTVIETTQFMSLDESAITTGLLDPTFRAANQLHSGALKVGMLGALPTTIAMQSLGLDGISIKMTGEQENQAETSAFLGVAAFVAILLIVMILVIQFNSTSKPFIIWLEIGFSIIGVLIGFSLFKMEISIVMSGVGVMALAWA